MNNLLTRRFTRREIILMLVLVLVLLIGLYFLLVHYPITERLAEIEEERDEIAFNTEIAEMRYGLYQSMKSELDEIFALPEDEITVMPEYDNNQVLLNYLHAIFDGTDVALTQDMPSANGNIVTRNIRFSFTAEGGYDQAKYILGQLTGTGYRCLMHNVSVTPAENGGEVEEGPLKVSGTITFYELMA